MLLEAEYARVHKREEKAFQLYDEAIQVATQNGYQLIAAIAYDCAGQYYARLGKKEKSLLYLNAAKEGFKRFGAMAFHKRYDILCSEHR